MRWVHLSTLGRNRESGVGFRKSVERIEVTFNFACGREEIDFCDSGFVFVDYYLEGTLFQRKISVADVRYFNCTICPCSFLPV